MSSGRFTTMAQASIVTLSREIIALGLSNLGPLLRVFLGSNAAKIARHANIVCLILPRRGA